MKKRKVEIGKVYSVKVDGAMLPVRVDVALARGGYEGMDMHSGKKVKVAAAAIRGDGRTCKDWHLQQQGERSAAKPALTDKEVAAAKEQVAKLASKAPGRSPVATVAKKARTVVPAPRPAGTGKRISGLDAAVTVLAEAGQPLSAGDMVKRMLGKGLWKTSGKTPAATIYTAVTMLGKAA
jgi:hypothetical protein